MFRNTSASCRVRSRHRGFSRKALAPGRRSQPRPAAPSPSSGVSQRAEIGHQVFDFGYSQLVLVTRHRRLAPITMQLFQLLFPERVDASVGVAHLDRKRVFVDAGAGDLAAVLRREAHLKEIVGDLDVPAVLAETIRDIGLGVEQSPAQVVGDTALADAGKVRSQQSAFRADRMALGAAGFAINLLPARAAGGSLRLGVGLQATDENSYVANFTFAQRSRRHFRSRNTFLDDADQGAIVGSACQCSEPGPAAPFPFLTVAGC